MLRVWCDFNSRTPDGLLPVLYYNDQALQTQIATLGIIKGMQVCLYQHEDDFDVIATLDFRYVDLLKREDWIAVPDGQPW